MGNIIGCIRPQQSVATPSESRHSERSSISSAASSISEQLVKQVRFNPVVTVIDDEPDYFPSDFWYSMMEINRMRALVGYYAD